MNRKLPSTETEKSIQDLYSENPNLVTIQKAAQALKVSKDTLRRWEAKGKITSIRTTSGYRLYDLKALNNAFKSKPQPDTAKIQFQTKAPIILPITSQTPLLTNMADQHSFYQFSNLNPEIVKLPTLEENTPVMPVKKIIDYSGFSRIQQTGSKSGFKSLSGFSIYTAAVLVLILLTSLLGLASPYIPGLNQTKPARLISGMFQNDSKNFKPSQEVALSNSKAEVLAASSIAKEGKFLQLNLDTNIVGNLAVEGEGVFTENLTAPNILYSLVAGNNISITGDTQNPTISSTVTLDDATNTTKGIASFSSSFFTVTSGAVTIKEGGITNAEIKNGTISNSDLANPSITVSAGSGLSGGGSVSLGGSISLAIDTVSLTSQISGILPVANGGTGGSATPTAGGIAYGTGSAYAFSTAGTSGQCLVSAGSSTPTWGACGGGSASGTTNTISKFTSSTALGDSLLTDDGTTFAINTNKFTVTEASGNTSIAGTLGVTSTLTASNGLTLTTGALSLTSTSGSISSTGLTGLTQTLSSGTAAITAPTLNLNTASTGNTAIGNATGTFALTSSGGLNVTTGGTLTGVASIDTISTSATAITFAAGGTIGATSTGLNLQADGLIDVNIAGGSGATGCTFANSTGNLTCTGNITGASSGTAGYWSRSGTTLSTATAADNVTVDGTFDANGIFTIGDGGDAGTISSTTLDIDATGALQINSSGGAISIGNDAVAQAISLGTGAAARTITVGNGTDATALNFTSGTGAQTFTSSVVSGTTTASAFAFNAASLTTGTALYVTSTATSGKTVDINASQTSGTIFNLAYGSAKTLSGDLTGLYVDLNSGNVDATNQNLTGVNFKIPTVTNTQTTATKTLTGMLVNFGSGAGINQNGAGGTLEYIAGDFQMPALTQTAGTLNAYGTKVTTPATITTGGTAYGNYISATGVGAGTLSGLGISNITGGGGTEYALNIGTGWDAVLRVGSTTVIDGSGITQVPGGGTGLSTVTLNGVVYGNTTSNLGVTAAGTTGQVLIATTGSAPSWGTISGSTCSDCVLTDPAADQTIAPTGQGTTGLTVRQTSTASPTDDIFQITSSDGVTKYFYVDKDGNVSTAGTSSQTLTLTPLTDTTALTLVGTNVSTQPLQYINSKNASATTGILNMAYGAAQTLSGSVIGFRQDLSTNVTATNQSVTGYQITLPGATNTSGTQAYTGLSISGGSINENGGTATTFTGAGITIPALTQTSGTLTGYGVNVTTPSSITTAGTAYGVNITASGVGAGTLYGMNISDITPGAGTENGLQIGSGWDTNLLFNDTTTRVAVADGGTITILDTSGNSLCTITDAGTTGNLSCSGTIGGTGTVGFWSKSGTTLSPATANDIVSIANTTTTGADLALTNTGVYTGTGIFNLTANAATTGTVANIAAGGLTTGNALSVSSTSTAGGASGSSYLLNLSRSGTNSNASHTAYGLYSAVTDTGTTSTNIAGYLSASGATNNYALIVPSTGGNVGIGTTAPNTKLYAMATNGDSSINTNVVTIGHSISDLGTGDSYTKLLLHQDGSDLSTTFTDSSATAHSVTANGNAKLTTGIKKFGTAAGLFDGTGDYLTIPDNADFDFGAGDFTVESWIYLDAAPAAGFGTSIFSQDDGGANFSPIAITLSTTRQVRAYASSNGTTWDIFEDVSLCDASSVLTTGSWHHFAVVRSGNSWYVFVDGTQCGTTQSGAGTLFNSTRSVYIGGQYQLTSGGGGLNGRLDEYRVSKGIARWTANFTPSTTAYGGIVGESGIASALLFQNENANSTLVSTGQISSIMTTVTDLSEVGALTFSTINNSGTQLDPTERMRITGAGNVGIGVSATAAQLDVLTPAATTGFNLAGTAPASVAGNGTSAATNTLAVVGTAGGASSGTTGQTGGTGGTLTMTAGIGGAVAGASGIGGVGGGVTLAGGAGGNGAATGGAGGAFSITAGAAGTGGNANGGTLTLNSGAVTGSGTSTLNLGSANATTVNLATATSATALNIGAASTTAVTVAIAGGSADTGCTVAGATGNLTCSGNITGSSSGTVGFWSRTGTTLSPATANDIVSIATTNTTGADLALTNTGIYTGTGIFNLTADSATTGTVANIAAGGLTTGNALAISSTSTAGGESGSSYLLNLSRSGTNSNASHTAYGLYSAVTDTGTTSTNIAGYLSASGATNNYALIVPSTGGLVGIGLTAPTAMLDITASALTTTTNAGLKITGTAPTSTSGNGAAQTATLSVLGAAGQATSGNLGATGGVGQTISLITGTGGAATTASGTAFGGAGGGFTLTAGNGGAANSSVDGLGGAGGGITLTAGNGGASGSNVTGKAGGNVAIAAGNSGTAGFDGNGGNVYIVGGASGGAAGVNGKIFLGTTSGGTVRGNIVVGASAQAVGSLTAKFDVDGSGVTSGILAQIGAPEAAVTVAGSSTLLTGLAIDLSNGYTIANDDVTGQSITLAAATDSDATQDDLLGLTISGGTLTASGGSSNPLWIGSKVTLPATTNTDSSATGIRLRGYDLVTTALTQTQAEKITITGFDLSAAGALVQNTNAGTIDYRGGNITLPAITQTTGTVTADGLRLTIPASAAITTAGVMNGINIVAPTTSGPAAGTLTGINIANLTSAGAGAENALSIGSGWDTDLAFVDTSPTVSIGDGGTISITDGTNTLCSIADAGTTGNLTCTGNITGSSSGTVGFWSRSGTTLSPATANDIASITSNSATAVLTLAPTGVTGTGLAVSALSGTTANTGINIGAISGTGATGTGITIGNISTTGTTNYGLQLGTMTGGTTSNYQISTDVLTSATTTTNAQINLGGVVTTGGTTNYGINIGALSGTGTTNTALNITAATSTGTTTGIAVGALSGAGTTNTGISVAAVSGATTNNALTTAGGAVSFTDASNTVASLSLTNNTATTFGNGGNTAGVIDLQSTTLSTGNFMNIEVNGLTTGTGFNLSSTGTIASGGELMSLQATGITSGRILDISSAANTLTSGQLVSIVTSSTALTGSTTAGSLLQTSYTGTNGSTFVGNLNYFDYSPASAPTTSPTGDLMRLHLGTNATNYAGNIFNIVDDTSSVFSVSKTTFTTSLPSNFTASGDVAIAYDINFTNPTASYIKSAAPLYMVAGETFNSSNLTLGTYNQGTIVLQTNNTTTTAADLTSSTLTTGIGLNLANSNASQTTATLLNVVQSGVTTGYTGNLINISSTGTTGAATFFNLAADSSTVGTLMSLSGNALTTGIGLIIDNGTSAMTTGSLLRVNAGGTGAIATNGIVSINHAGAYTSTSNAGLLNVSATGLTGTGTVVNISASNASQATDTLLNVAQTGATTTVASPAITFSTTATTNASAKLLSLTANAMTVGDIMSISGTGLTTGSALVLTGSSAAPGQTDALLKLSGNLGSMGAGNGLISSSATINTTGASQIATNLYLLTTNAPTTNSNQGYGIYHELDDATALANSVAGEYLYMNLSGDAAKTIYGKFADVRNSSNVGNTVYSGRFTVLQSTGTTSGTSSLYGVYSSVLNNGITDTNAASTYGGYFTTTGNTGGTGSTAYGVWATASGADNNYPFYSGAAFPTANTAGLCWDNAGESAIYDCNGTPTDLAENYGTSDSSIEAGDVVTMSGQAQQVLDPREGKITTKAYIAKSTGAYNSQILGIVSTNPNQTYGEDGLFSSSENPRPVSLTGRVPVKVSAENGPIHSGDYLTSSSTPGVAMKSTKPGVTIGRALNDFTGNGTGKVVVYVHTGYADPSEALANLLVAENGSLVGSNMNLQKLTVASDVTVGGIVSASNYTLNAANINRVGVLAALPVDSQNRATVSEAINLLAQAQNSQESRIADLASKEASTAAALADAKVLGEQALTQTSSLQDSVASTSATIANLSSQIEELFASITGNSNPSEASPSDQLALTPPTVMFASDSATLDTLTVTSDATVSGQLMAYAGIFQDSLKSLGDTFLGKTNIAGDLSVDGTYSVTGGSKVNALPILYFQTSPLAEAVDFFNGLVTVTKNGTIAAKEIVTEKITVKANSSAGQVVMPAGAVELPVLNELVEGNSIIILTSETTGAPTLAVVDKVPGAGFVVRLSAPFTQDIHFSYLVVGQK